MLSKYIFVCILREWDDGMSIISPLVNTVLDLKMVLSSLAKETLLMNVKTYHSKD